VFNDLSGWQIYHGKPYAVAVRLPFDEWFRQPGRLDAEHLGSGAVPEDLDAIFDRMRPLLAEHSPPFVARTGGVRGKRDYQLWSERDVVIDGRPRSEVYFAGLIGQKSYVGFYYMPAYAEPERRALFAPELLKLLKGKACFHVRRLDDELAGHVEQALADGRRLYEERGWV
jgi:hypothetical protein